MRSLILSINITVGGCCDHTEVIADGELHRYATDLLHGRREQAVTVEAGAIWGQVYDAVTTKGGRYVQGGRCMTVALRA